ncbi:MAG: T9SS type A sorting domain-containing protein [Ignavibacteriales bacterium]|nr:MAG: T9SS type A sorting domain-containing protein [Ignavibacteriales bacterium]
MKKLSFLLLCGFMLLGTNNLFGQVTETEPNNSCGQAGIKFIDANTVYSGSVEEFVDGYDYWYIAPGTSGTVTIAATGTFFEVFSHTDANCGSVGYQRDGDGNASNPFVMALNPARYYIVVVSAPMFGTANYTLTVSGGTFASSATGVYLTENSSDVDANIAYPKVGFGSPITSPFSWTPTSPDWTYNAPKCTLYVVPTGDDGLVASSFVVNFDATKATLTASAGDNNLFESGIFYTQATGAGRLKVNASNISSAINVTPGSGKYLARLIFTMLKPGHMEITIDSLDFRQYDVTNNEQVEVETEDFAADVKFYLGDFASASVETTGDGLININDLSLFASAYWSNHAQVSTLYKSKFDVGPTNASGNYFALPTADGNINFEDLIIFSVGYGKSAGNELPKVKVNPINVTLGEEIVGSTVRVPVYLSGSVEDVRGLSFSFRTGMTLKGVEKAGGLNNENGFVIFRQEGDLVQIDAAVIGADKKAISAEGIVAYLVFENKSSLELEAVIARNSFNQDIPVLMKGSSALSITPDAYELSQNYPNPFNPSTVISFALPSASQVTLQVYNSLGKEVAVLVNNEMLDAGVHTRNFDASELTSGVYMYKITAGGFTSVRKMMFIK